MLFTQPWKVGPTHLPFKKKKKKKKQRQGKVKPFQVPTDQQSTPNLSQKFHKRKVEENKGNRVTP